MSITKASPFLLGGGVEDDLSAPLLCSKLAKVMSVCSDFASCAVNESPSRVFIFECVNEWMPKQTEGKG